MLWDTSTFSRTHRVMTEILTHTQWIPIAVTMHVVASQYRLGAISAAYFPGLSLAEHPTPSHSSQRPNTALEPSVKDVTRDTGGWGGFGEECDIL